MAGYLVLEELIQVEQDLRHLGVLGGVDADLGGDLLGGGLSISSWELKVIATEASYWCQLQEPAKDDS